MRHVAAAVAAAVMLTLSLVDAPSAGVGDYRLVHGRIAVWPPEPFAYGVAMLQTDNGQPYFVEFTPVTAGATGLRPGDNVTVVGREGPQPERITALTVERRTSASARTSNATVSPSGRRVDNEQRFVAPVAASSIAGRQRYDSNPFANSTSLPPGGR